MKKGSLFIFRRGYIAPFLILCILFLSPGCKKSTNDHPVGITGNINSTPWTATTYIGYIDTLYPGPLAGIPFLAITAFQGTSASAFYIKFGLDNYTGQTGTYTIAPSSPAYAIVSDYASDHEATSGTITLLKVSNTNVQGKFSFTTDSFTVTNGQFDVNLQ